MTGPIANTPDALVPSEPPPPYIDPAESGEGAIESRAAQQAGETAAFLSALSGRRARSNTSQSQPGNSDNEPDSDWASTLSDSEDDDLHDAPSHRTQMGVQEVQREMEQFEIYDPAAEPINRGPSFTSRAATASQRFAKNIGSKIFTPVSRMLDPVAQLINRISRRFDALISKFGNPLILKRLLYLFFVFLIIYVSFESGLLPGSAKDAFGGSEYYDRDSLMTFLHDAIEPNVMKERLHYISSMPHQAGTSGDLALARYIQDQFEGYRLEPVELAEHQVYLTYPNGSAGSMVLELLDGDKVTYAASLVEDEMYGNGTDATTHQQPTAYHAFSKAGSAEGPVIYVNYGSKEDLELLKSKNIDLNGAILLAKMGKVDLGVKAKLAHMYGAVGMVTFSDHPDKTHRSWPEGPSYPEGAIQRGSASIPEIVPGDILTPGWSSISKHRVADPGNVQVLPEIPILPASWRDIKPFLEALKGHGVSVSNDWESDRPEIGEWWSGDQQSPRARMATSPIVKDRNAIWNVFGKIGGVEQGELAIVIGAKRDSWCYGAIESGSGTAVLLELARIFSHMRSKLDWVPLRSIYFASWDGSNHNYAGSTEWVELNVDELRRNGAVYISVDEAVAGKNFEASGHPMLERALYEILQQVRDPATNTTLGSQNSAKAIRPFREPGDYLAFQSHAGMASFQLGFKGNHYPKSSCFDSFEWVERFGETPDFAYHKTITDIAARLVLKLSDDPIIPFDLAAYARYVGWFLDDLKSYAESQSDYSEGKLDLDPLWTAVNQFKASAERYSAWYDGWTTTVESSGEPPVFSVHRWSWNSHLVGLDKHLLDNNGIPGRPWFKHVIFGPQMWHPSTQSRFAWGTFPAVRDFIEARQWDMAQVAVNRIATIMSISANKLPIK